MGGFFVPVGYSDTLALASLPGPFSLPWEGLIVVKKLIIGMLAAAALVLAVPISANATETEEVWWRVPDGVQLEPSDHPLGDGFRVGPEGFPQVFLPGGMDDLGCGEVSQVDIYRAADVPALIEDGVLEYGEDWDVILSWRFVQGLCLPDEPDENVVPEIPEVEVPDSLPRPVAPVKIATARA